MIDVDVPPPSKFVFELHGLAVSPAPTQPGVSGNFNWYDGNDEQVVALKTYFPDVKLGGGRVTLWTAPESPLAAVLGASAGELELAFYFGLEMSSELRSGSQIRVRAAELGDVLRRSSGAGRAGGERRERGRRPPGGGVVVVERNR